MTIQRPIDLDAPDARRRPRRRAPRPAGDGPRLRPERDRARPVPRRRRRRRSRSTTGGRPTELGDAIDAARGPAGPAAGRARRGPGVGLGGRGARRRPRPRSTRTTRRPSRASATALRALVDRRRGGDPDAPALVSEPDLFLRLCPAPTIGVTGTKGKTTTSSLIAALLAADPAHPVVLGGNIGIPLVERLPELTPEHRVVIELCELQLPTLSRGTTVAVYTNVTSDHLDRHGSLEGYRAAKRRLAELVDPARRARPERRRPGRGGLRGLGRAGRRDRLVRARRAARRAASGVVGEPDRRRRRRGPGRWPIDELAIPGRHNVSNALAAVADRLAGSGSRPTRSAGRRRRFTGVEHRLETVATVDGVRFVNDSQGTQPDAVIAALRAFDAADRPDRRRPRQGRRPVGPAAGRRGAGRRGGPDRRERPDARAAVPATPGLRRTEHAADPRGGRPDRRRDRPRARSRPARPGPATVLLSPAAASFDMFVDYAARGRAFKAAVAAIAAERDPRRTR